MAEHTPGPWRLVGKSGDGKAIFIEAAGDGWARLDCEVDSDDCDSDTAMANARLIAEAPALLAAAEHLGQTGHRFGSVASEGCPECVAAKQAIARARDKKPPA